MVALSRRPWNIKPARHQPPLTKQHPHCFSNCSSSSRCNIHLFQIRISVPFGQLEGHGEVRSNEVCQPLCRVSEKCKNTRASSYCSCLYHRSSTASCALPQAVGLGVMLARKRRLWAHDRTHVQYVLCPVAAPTSKFALDTTVRRCYYVRRRAASYLY